MFDVIGSSDTAVYKGEIEFNANVYIHFLARLFIHYSDSTVYPSTCLY